MEKVSRNRHAASEWSGIHEFTEAQKATPASALDLTPGA
jgi:hypothetical protein